MASSIIKAVFGALFRRIFTGPAPVASTTPPAPSSAEVSAGDGLVEFRPHALDRTFFISGPPGDQSVLEELRHSHAFEPHIVGLLARVVTPDTVALDVGANLGVLSVVIGTLAAKGRVLALEASTVAYAHLQATLAANGVRNVETAHLAVYRESGRTLHLNTSSAFLAGSHLTSDADATGGTEAVHTITIDDWVAQYGLPRVDLVKMDIEGAELDALAGAHTTLSRCAPALLIECNAVVMRRFHRRSSRDLFDVLSRYYRHIYLVPETSRNGDVVRLDAYEQLQEALALGRGNEDLFCTSAPVDLPSRPFAQWIDELRGAPDASEIVIDPSYRLEVASTMVAGAPGERVTLQVVLHNDGAQRLASSGRFPVHVSYHVYGATEALVQFDGVRSTLGAVVRSAESVRVDVAIVLPDTDGDYRMALTLVQEGIAWLEDLGGATASIHAHVRSVAP